MSHWFALHEVQIHYQHLDPTLRYSSWQVLYVAQEAIQIRTSQHGDGQTVMERTMGDAQGSSVRPFVNEDMPTPGYEYMIAKGE